MEASRNEEGGAGSLRPVHGLVRSGVGSFARWMRLLAGEYRRLTGVDLVPGTLNVELPAPWRSPPDARVLPPDPERGTVEVLVTPCRIEGRPGYVLRTRASEDGRGDHPRSIVEVASTTHLRTALGLADGDRAQLELPWSEA